MGLLPIREVARESRVGESRMGSCDSKREDID